MTINQFFELYKDSENVYYRENESKVFNLSGINTPLKTYDLAFDYNGGTFKIYYEDFQNTPPGLAAYGGRQLCFLKCTFPVNQKVSGFSIEKRGLIARVLKPNPYRYFIVKTKDNSFLNSLLSDEHLITIYKKAEQSSLSPVITGKSTSTRPYQYEISVSYGATVFDSEVLGSAIEFCKNMIDSNCSH